MRIANVGIILLCMKNITLCGINARYSHSSFSLLCLKSAAATLSRITIKEFSINDRVSQIADRLHQTDPDAVGFSCYIWNIEHVLKTASIIKKIRPECLILLGGPEVSFDSADIMRQYRFVDMIIRGAGEAPFEEFLRRFEAGISFYRMPSACIRQGARILSNPAAPPYDWAGRTFMYEDLGAFDHKVVYYETSRGCPFQCAYCMSAGESVAFLPLDKVKQELECFVRANVSQVKLVDRTFNFPCERAYEIIKTMIDLSNRYPQSATSFHLEISASLLDGQTLDLIRQGRDGLLRFEVGIQSTHPETLQAVRRTHDMQKLLDNTRILCTMHNIHVHADLIAGLPHESYALLKKSFNDVFCLNPDTLQLGFLKVLKGAPIRDMAESFDIVFQPFPPYEVLSTHVLSYDELSALHKIETVFGVMYNDGCLKKTLDVLIPAFESPFDFFEQFTAYLDHQNYFKRPHALQDIFDYVYVFAMESGAGTHARVQEALIFDWLNLQKTASVPQSLDISYSETERKQIRAFYLSPAAVRKYVPAYAHLSPKEIDKRCRIYLFRHLYPIPTAVLFDAKTKRVAAIDPADWPEIVSV